MQHRETQGHESALFQSYFKSSGIRYVRRGDKHVYDPDRKADFEPKLYTVRKMKRSVRVIPVPLELCSLHQSGVFIFDEGDSISVWSGRTAHHFEKYAASIYVQT